MLSSAFRLALLFLFFGFSCADAQEHTLPAPFEGKWYEIDFCITEKLVAELLEEGYRFGTISRQKEGCGILAIPMYLNVTPLYWSRFEFGDRVIVKVTNAFGDIAFSWLEPSLTALLRGKVAQEN